VEPRQLDLFSDSEMGASPEMALGNAMDADALVRWKSQIAAYQQSARTNSPALQTTLFDLAPVHADPDAIDPFSLHLYPMSFYRFASRWSGLGVYLFCARTLLNLSSTSVSCRSQE